MRAWPTSTSTRAAAEGALRGSLVGSEPEITVRRPEEVETSVATVLGGALEGAVALEVEVALEAASTAETATGETTTTLVVWIGGATSRHRSRLPCQPDPMETTC